jgi:hypothetical protein
MKEKDPHILAQTEVSLEKPEAASTKILKKVISTREAVKDTIILDPIPADPNLFLPENIRQIEDSFGKPIEDLASCCREEFEVQINGTQYKDRPQNLFARIQHNFLAKGATPATGRLYLTLRKKAQSHEEAIAACKAGISKPIPVSAEMFSPEIISKIEKALGKSISEISTKDRTRFSLEVDEKNFTDVVQNLLYRISDKLLLFKSPSAAKLYLMERKKNLDHATALESARKAENLSSIASRKSRISSIPIEPKFLTSDVICKVESALGKKLEEISVGNNLLFSIQVDDKEYSDKFVNIIERVSSAVFKIKDKARARLYLTLIRDGVEHEQARIQSGNFDKDSQKNTQLIPMVDEMFSATNIVQIEKAIGKKIEEISTGNVTYFTITIEKKSFTETPNKLFQRISDHFFGVSKPGSAREYLVLRKKGMDHSEAVKRIMDSLEGVAKREVNKNTIPVEPESLSSSLIGEIEKALGGNLQTMSLHSNAKFSVTIRGVSYEDKYRSFLMRISRTYFQSDNARLTRDYLSYRKEGKDHDIAVKLVSSSDEPIDVEFREIDKIKMNDAIALLGHDPAKLKLYLQYAHKELDEDYVDQLVIRSFKGLTTAPNKTKEEEYLGWDMELPEVILNEEIPESTDQHTITISGTAADAECVYLSGAWNRRVAVDANGTFSVSIPLKVGESNEIKVMGLNREQQKRSEQQVFSAKQTGEADDLGALFTLLSEMRTDLQKEISKEPGRLEFFTRCAERMLIKKFSLSFAEGEEYIEELIEQNQSKVIRKVLQNVLKRFQAIERAKFPNVKDGSLMFFQKYTAYEIRRRMKEGKKGINVANDPGTGKTRTILAAIADEEASIFTPNAVVSAWDEEAAEILRDPELLVLRNVPHEQRKELLRKGTHLRLVTNVQFLQNSEDAERFRLLSNDNTVVVHDEAHSRANENSQQSVGAKKLKHKFQINVTATLAKDPKSLRRMLATLEPNNPKFKSDEAFMNAFPAKEPEALKSLKLLIDKYTIRFRKEDVMEEVDPDSLLSDQLHRLPKKVEVPSEDMGAFEMSEDQAEAIYEMFRNWPEWTRKYDHYIPNDELAEEDHLRSGGALVKRHALRQTVNNPSYVDSKAEDAKLREAEKVVAKCLKDNRKIVIFCAYASQAEKYAEHFKAHKPALYTGRTSNECEKKDGEGNPLKFQKKGGAHGFKRGWEFDTKGYPKLDPKGEPMQALDYERLTFQKAADRKIIICTYNAGSVGTTFTAGKAMILDDLPRDVIEDIQAKDRIHRIDPHHMTHPTVEYYSLVSRYPQSFLDRMKKRWVVKQADGTFCEYRSLAAAQKDEHCTEKNPAKSAFEMFFAQGTYDQVQSQNLGIQRQMFRLMNDGIADESVLKEGQLKFAGLENGNGGAH